MLLTQGEESDSSLEDIQHKDLKADPPRPKWREWRAIKLLAKVPAYFWMSLGLFICIETLAVVGSVYFALSVRNTNINNARDVTSESARYLEKLLYDQRAPVLSLAHWVKSVEYPVV
jgi:hypothetical protein